MDLAEKKSILKNKIDAIKSLSKLNYIEKILNGNYQESSVTDNELNELMRRRQNVIDGNYKSHKDVMEDLLNEDIMG